ncbi:ATP-binding protein [Rhodanobacter sp. L36]|uniref:ATP-binding protein n=1 Tax=Rhodanobacter sp. L36 TaxID=1747221 RepID=UPI00131BDD26|nr:ATP-binding protein [Rhodanobacter sp. L36]
MFERLRIWLNRLPIADPVDRSNAFFMQFFFALIGCVQLLNKAFILEQANWKLLYVRHSYFFPWPHLPMVMDLSTDVAMAASAWFGIYLIRTGRFRTAVIQYLSVLMVSAILFFATVGVPDSRDDASFFEALIISGLMLGRRALWTIFAATMLVYLTGITTEVLAPPNLPMLLRSAFSELPGTVYTYVTVAIIIDFSAQALRNSLARSHADHHQLQLEIAEREQVQEQLLHSRKMDAVGRLASGIAHDIHNVLGIILGFARVRERVDEPDLQFGEDAPILVDALEGTELAARRGAAICRKLLNFSRRDVARAETFDMLSTIEEVRPLLHQLLPPSVRLVIESEPGDLAIHFDRNQFELGLLNLVSNARDAMPDGGVCTISVSRPSSSRALLSVRDTGIGMSDDHVQRIFEPFFTTKPSGSGTGLGLSVVYNLVQSAGGEISVESEEGRGTVFHIALPTTLPATQPELVTSDDVVRVLLIDDDDDLRTLLGAALESSGCLVGLAASGAETERFITQTTQLPDVLICDHRMPDTDGLSLLRKLRLQMPDVPAILISAYLETDGQPPGLIDPLSERLPKPFAPDVLVARVHAAAKRHRALLAAASA